MNKKQFNLGMTQTMEALLESGLLRDLQPHQNNLFYASDGSGYVDILPDLSEENQNLNLLPEQAKVIIEKVIPPTDLSEIKEISFRDKLAFSDHSNRTVTLNDGFVIALNQEFQIKNPVLSAWFTWGTENYLSFDFYRNKVTVNSLSVDVNTQAVNMQNILTTSVDNLDAKTIILQWLNQVVANLI